jgi:acetyl-CoA C-acetyltransferase
MSKRKVFIAAAKRTAIGAFGGSLSQVPLRTLGSEIIRAVLDQAKLAPEHVEEVILGNILSAGQGMGPARQAAIDAGIPASSPAYSLNMLCGSGMKAVMTAASQIVNGDSDIIIAGGMENMSMAPYLMPAKSRFGTKLGHLEMLDHMIHDGLTDAFGKYHMGVTAENIAKKHGLTRDEQDRFAASSQEKAAKAQAEGRFKDEIAAIEIVERRKTVVFDRDEYIKPETTVEALAGLRPAFDKEGTVTAGNASGINDGAAMLLLVSEEACKKHNLEVLAEIADFSQAGIDPAYMGLGPVPAINKLMKKTAKSLKDMELIELNEAFASQSLGVVRELAGDLSEKEILARCNVNGGAIALGHPIGASGARILVTLIYEMKKRSAKQGLASLCIGGGMGTAMILKMD